MKVRRMSNEKLIEEIKNSYRNCPHSKYFYHLKGEMHKRRAVGKINLDKVTRLLLARHGVLVFQEDKQ